MLKIFFWEGGGGSLPGGETSKTETYEANTDNGNTNK